MLDKITVPCLITYGKRKSLYHPANSEWLRDHIPGSKLAGFNGGHIHFLQDADAFNQAVLSFIDA